MKLKNIVFLIIFVALGFIIDKKLSKTEDKAEVSLKFQEKVERIIEKDINKLELDDLLKHGLTLKKAEKIIEFREAVGVILNLSELERISGFGQKTVEKLRGILIVSENIEMKDKNKLQINTASEEMLTWYGFSKKEISKISEYIKENKGISSNLDMREILTEQRYLKYKSVIIYTKYN